jgi:hypothetical protein
MAETSDKNGQEALWYVIHTYSGYEKRVKATQQQKRRDIRQRTCRYKNDRLIARLQEPCHQLDGFLLDNIARRLGQLRSVETGHSVDAGCDDQVAEKRLGSPRRTRHIQPDQRHDTTGVIRRLRERLIAADSRDRENNEFLTRVRENPRDRVVVTGVTVKNYGYFLHFVTPL